MKKKVSALMLSLAMAFSLAACGSTPADSGGTSEPAASADASTAPAPSQAEQAPVSEAEGQTLRLTLEGAEGTQEITATLMDTPAAEEFAQHLPFTIEMHEHLDRQKEVYLPFSLSEESQANTVTEYEIGDIVYWHPGPTLGIFHDHDGSSINAGIEVLAKLDEGGAEAVASYADLVTVTFALDEAEQSPSAAS